MDATQLCAILAATEADVLPGKWERVRDGQEELVKDLTERAPLPQLQELADHVFWAAAATEAAEAGLIQSPRIHVKGADRIVEIARSRGLTVPKASPREALFESAESSR
jgi:hypothetical protein